MNASNHNQNGRSRFSIFRRAPKWMEITGYHVGDIQSDKPVAVTNGATLVGNIFAPKISVAGLLYGSTVARETIIQTQGQIWGDVYTGRLEITPGGKIQGWVSNLDEAGYQTLQTTGVIPSTTKDPVPGPFELPADVIEGQNLVRGETQINVLRRLQAEAAAALAARIELEQTFEKRLMEVAGETKAKAESLHQELTTTRTQLNTVQEQHEQTLTQKQAHETQIERLNNELLLTRQLLSERKSEFDRLFEMHAQQGQNLNDLTKAKTDVDNQLHMARQEIDSLFDRVNSLEGALQASLQHSAEQEEALVRWQELAEVTETKAKNLENELHSVNLQVTESARVNDMLKAQRRQAEEAWEKAIDELEEIRRKETKPLGVYKAQADAETLIEELQATITTKSTELQAQIEQIASLKEMIQDAENVAQQYREQRLWDKASLETARRTLDEAQQREKSQEARMTELLAQLEKAKLELSQAQNITLMQKSKLEQVQEELEVQTATLYEAQEIMEKQESHAAELQIDVEAKSTALARLQGDLDHLTNEVSQREEEIGVLKADVAALQEQNKNERASARKTLRERDMRMQALEAETESYAQQAQTQGQRLAEIQAALIEREIELDQVQSLVSDRERALNQARATAVKQSQFIKRMQQVTTERIEKLQTDLAQSRQQLKDLTAVLERRQKR